MRAYRTSEGYQSVPDEQGSPTLAASQPLWARTQTSTESSAAAGESLGAGVDPSSFKGYQPVQQPSHPPYPSSPILQTQDRQDYRSDPYRSAYSQHHHHQFQQRGSHSPYHDSPASFEEMNQMTHSSKYSLSSTNSGGGGGHNGNGGHQQYEMRRLHSLEPDQTTSIPDQYPLPNAHSSQQRLKQEEEGKNADVIPKTSSETGTPSGVGQSSLSSKGKKKQCYNSEDSDEEEGQERGALRQKDSKRCWCCSRRTCVYISFVVLICLAVALYFVVPRSPSFSFESVTPLGDPVVTKNQIQESFSLQMRVDSQVNYVPLRFTSLEMGVWMKIDQTKIGNNEGLPSSFLIRPRIAQVISVPMTLDYRSLKIDTNADGTLQELFTACKPVDLSSGALVPGINLTIGGKMFIRGLSWIWKPQFSFNVDRVPCPVNARKHVTEPTSPSSGSGAGAETPSGSNGGASETMSQTTNPSITPSSRSSQASTPGNTAGSTTTLSS
ncbi:hypothetical protein BCR41DRAFT_372325 [Lobosporangium transversale]|uniref:Uncharacterized protein n=1 Tax=Lobosporangium transversale TaxID=64571 RepID=A0A1Y2GGV5_9FUNG|nr:hypothetical protein BCR41DRAFT_372325 [Lobosporangium transversale]ORZ10575.1 hypothetical protein BCR41DRAFT_372325 [Lobosporangium transversale]|eukprot:XP_021879296.1 hypothetical protein BCR41DRAFT_372325 [Lobosporangium transversale]